MERAGTIGIPSGAAAWPQLPKARKPLRGRHHQRRREFVVFSSERVDTTQTEQNQDGKFALGSGATAKRRTGGDWAAQRDGDAPAGSGHDRLAELGKAQDYNINVDHGQSIQHLDYLFAGDFLGTKSDIASGELRNYETRSFGNIQGDYYIAPSFLEAVALHITKNFLNDQGTIEGKVPLILGIWGGKGQGKSFQTELAFKKLGVVPIIMSAGELEHEVAGTPGLLIRERYKKAAGIIKNQGKMSCLMINDLDAGIGRFQDSQCTVNNQMVVGTLMNLCDDPNSVSTGEDWREGDSIARVPIIVTGNDFSRIYAPLVRDGRMEKFYWNPSREDMANILHCMYKDDGLTMEDMGTLLDAFPNQPLDFYGAMRASCYDDHIRDWLNDEVLKGLGMNEWSKEHTDDLKRRLIFKQDLPNADGVVITLDRILAEGWRLVAEQEHVMSNKLSEDYLKDLKKEKEVMEIIREEMKKPPPPPPPPMHAEHVRVDTSEYFRKELEMQKEAGILEYMEVQAPGLEEEEEDDWADGPWPQPKPDTAMALIKEEGYVFLDVRPVKDFGRDSFNDSINIPAVQVSGFGASETVSTLDNFASEVEAAFPDLGANILVCGGIDGRYATEAIELLLERGYTCVAEVCGGYSEWATLFRSNGERRWTFSAMQHLGDSHSLHM